MANTATATNAHLADLERLDATEVEIQQLIADLSEIDQILSDALRRLPAAVERVDPGYQRSARNLIQYLALRRHDLRPLQMELSELGLSSLGRSEGSIQASIQSVLTMLHALIGRPDSVQRDAPPVRLLQGDELLREHADLLFGPPPAGRSARIMVTAATELAGNLLLMGALLDAGMDVLRINCAHDDPVIWKRVIDTCAPPNRSASARPAPF